MTSQIQARTEDTFFYDTSGYSMWPFLLPKQKLIVKKVGFESLRVGDIILYRAGNNLICHRLVKKTKTGGKYSFYSRGDASLSGLEPVNCDMFIGRVCGLVKNGAIVSLEGLSRPLVNRLIVVVAPFIGYAVKAAKIILGRNG